MKIVHEIMYKVEVLYVLCVLLMGRQRNQVLSCFSLGVFVNVKQFFADLLYRVCSQVHKMLAEFRLIPGLNNLFDKLIWRKYTASNHVVHGQNENCDCSPVWTFNLQVIWLKANKSPCKMTIDFFSSCRKYPSKSSFCGYFRASVITMSKWP